MLYTLLVVYTTQKQESSIPPTSCKVRQGNPFAIMREMAIGSFDPLNIVLVPFVLLADECNRVHAKWTVNYVRVSTVGSHEQSAVPFVDTSMHRNP
jgi:hypothetical protein